jgi:hypothetical protein
MTLARRLAKLEKAAGKGEPCALCRLMLRRHPPDPFRRLPGRAVSCPRCGTKYKQSPPSEAPEGANVKARVLALYSTFEPDDFFTDRRARAVRLWYFHHPFRAASDALRGEGGELEKAQARLRRREPPPGEKVDRETAKARERRAALIEEARATLRREDAERRRRLGLRFPDLERLAPRLSARAGHSADPRVEASRLLAFAKLEKVIFGEAQPETLEALAHWRAARAEKRGGELRLAQLNAGRKAAGRREFYSLDDAERTLKREREEAERLARPAAVSPAEPSGTRFRNPRVAGGGESQGEHGEGKTDPSYSLVYIPPDVEPPRRADASSPDSEDGLAMLRKLAEFAPEYVVNDPTAGLHLAPDGEIVGPDGEPPETPDPRRRYYAPERPEPSRRYSVGDSAPARRYRPRT